MKRRAYIVGEIAKELNKISEIRARVKKIKKHGLKLELRGLTFKGMSFLSKQFVSAQDGEMDWITTSCNLSVDPER